MSSSEYVEYVTEKVLKYFFATKEEKKQLKRKKKEQRGPFLFRWFGILPLAILVHVRKRKG